MRTFFIVVAVIVALALALGALTWSGWYNVAAASPGLPFVEWWLDSVSHRSIAAHARSVDAPPLAEQDLALGFRRYHELCVDCHGAPGLSPSAVGQGLNPAAPGLEGKEIQEWSAAELYWIVKNGIRMSGMPAFGVSQSEAELWALVAFLRRLQTLSADEYETFVETPEARAAAD